MSLYFETHIFVCENKREEGHPRGCCMEKGSKEIRSYLKTRAKELKLPKTRVNSAGCLDRCELGPVLVVYPKGEWYHCPSVEAAEEILQHIAAGKPHEKYALTEKQKRLLPHQS